MIDFSIEGPSLASDTPDPLIIQTDILPAVATEDNRLLCRVAAKDTQAFDHLYRKYKPRLERYLARYLHQPSTVEETCNDTMMVVWKKAGQFRSTSKVSTWIFGIARLEAKRKLTRTITGLDQSTQELPEEADVTTPAVILDLQEQVDTLTQAVATLPSTLRTPITLAYYHDYSYAQIARHLNCSQTTVKSRLRQARRRLKTILRRANNRRPTLVQRESHPDAPGLM